MAEVKWIKICTDIFDDEKVVLIESMPDADGIIVIWFKLLCLAGKQNNGGVFMLNDKIAYTDEMLAHIFRRSLTTVRLALKTFEDFGMIEIVDNVVTIPKWEKHQSLDVLEKNREANRKKIANYRAKQKRIAAGDCNGYSNGYSNGYCNADVTGVDKEEDKERDKDIKRKKEDKEIVISNKAHACAPAQKEMRTYEDVMTDMAIEESVKPTLWEFIRHCQLNGHTLTDAKLTNILVDMDMRRLSAQEKIDALQAAINGGYFDIKR